MLDRLKAVLTPFGDQTVALWERSATFLTSLFWSAFILVIVVWALQWVRRRARRAIQRRGIRNNFADLADNIVRVLIYLVAVVLALSASGVETNALITFVGLATAAISLSLQDVLKNFFAGLYLLAEQPFSPGDRIRVAGEEGRVSRIDLRTTVLQNDRAEEVLVPNARVFTEVVGNRTAFAYRQLTMQVTGVPGDPDAAEAAMHAALTDLGEPESNPTITFLQVGKEGADLEVTVRLKPDGRLEEQRAVLMAVHRRFPDSTVKVVGR